MEEVYILKQVHVFIESRALLWSQTWWHFRWPEKQILIKTLPAWLDPLQSSWHGYRTAVEPLKARFGSREIFDLAPQSTNPDLPAPARERPARTAVVCCPGWSTAKNRPLREFRQSAPGKRIFTSHDLDYLRFQVTDGSICFLTFEIKT